MKWMARLVAVLFAVFTAASRLPPRGRADSLMSVVSHEILWECCSTIPLSTITISARTPEGRGCSACVALTKGPLGLIERRAR
jgi:hypothetical protein